MNWNQVKTNWTGVREQIHARWGKLTEADLNAIAGSRSELITRLRQRYDLSEKKAEKAAETFVKTLH